MLYIPSEMMQPQEIYIRHVECDKNGNVKSNNGNPVLLSELKNSSEIQMYNYNSSSNSWNEKLVNNMFSKVQNETGISENYQEYYDIPIDNASPKSCNESERIATLPVIIPPNISNTENKILIYYYEFDSLIFMPLMFLGEFFAGLIIFSYQRKFLINLKVFSHF